MAMGQGSMGHERMDQGNKGQEGSGLASSELARSELERTRRQRFAAFPPRLRVGEFLDGFRISAEIARGATGVVYEAEDLREGREVALKVLSPDLVIIPDAVARFRNESTFALKARGPGVVPIYRQGLARDHHYYAMELEGRETARHLHGASTEWSPEGFFERMAALFSRLGWALHRIHKMGIVHRDVKPTNLLVGWSGDLLLCDFGSALDVRNPDPPRAEDLWGTVRYMSPEQFLPEADPFDPRVDVYSLGVTMYEVITGTPIFPKCTPDEMVALKLKRVPPAPREVDPTVPLSLDAIIRQAMDPHPQLRYPTAGEMAEDLERFARSLRGRPRER